ncbi:MAG: succinate dehydrogenase, cytochrome b556 subunit [Chloroflexi bacterium]|nr:succinate dehydrogenase, cytochrome b556 subunit [Chloroflexota bacterium]
MKLTKRDVYLGRGLGMWAWLLHRVTGLLLVFYLILHILVISSSLGGSGLFDPLLRLLQAPLFVLLEMGLAAAVLIHGLNGIRIVLFDLGLGVRRQKEVFAVLMALAAALWVWAVLVAYPNLFRVL